MSKSFFRKPFETDFTNSKVEYFMKIQFSLKTKEGLWFFNYFCSSSATSLKYFPSYYIETRFYRARKNSLALQV